MTSSPLRKQGRHERHRRVGAEQPGRRRVVTTDAIRPPPALEAFSDLDEALRQSVARVTASLFVPHKDSVHGVYEGEKGTRREVQ